MGFKRKRNQDFGQDAIVGGVLPYFGSNDKDQTADYLSDIDISQPYSTTSSTGAPIILYSPADPTNQPKIKTPTRFRSGVVKFRTPEDDQEITIITESMSGSYNLALPSIGAHDRLLTRDTISTIASIGKTALPAAIAYEDENNTFSQAQTLNTYFNMKSTAAPGSPAATYARLFYDSGDSKLKIKKADGTVIDLEALGPGGGLDERVIIKEAGTAISATARRLDFTDAALWDITEDVPNDEINIDIAAGGITNSHLAGSITYSKLSMAGSILNADIHTAAAIAYGKLNLTGAILDADLAGSITDAKLAQITDKAKLPSTVAYEDENNTFSQAQTFDNYVNLKSRAEPTDPSATYMRLFHDIADGKLKVKKSTGTLVDLESGGGGGGGAGGGMAAGGIVTKSGNASEIQFLIPHGLSPTPEIFWVEPASPDAFGHFERDVDATNIVIRYAAPPPSATNNLIFNWAAGYINAAGGGFTPDSTTEMSNKIIANWLDYKEIAEPASPTTDIGRTFFDAADGHLKIKKSDGTVLDLETAGGGGGGGGGGMAAGGVIQRSGNSTTTVFTIPHGLSPQPELYWAEPASADAIGNREITVDSTNIIITYGVAPPLAFNNLTFHWAAGYINAATGGFTPSSTTEMTGKTIPIDTNILKHSTTNALGDVYKSDGTKVVRVPRGTPGQYWKVNALGTDVGWENDAIVVTLNDIQDVALSAPVYNQRLIYDGLNWVNTNPPPTENPIYKSGEWYPLTASDYYTGIISDGVTMTGSPTLTRVTDSRGMYTKITTPAAPALSGLTQTAARYRRELESRLYAYFHGDSGVSNTQYFIGFTSSATAPAADAPFDAGVSGILVMLRQADNGSPPGTLKAVHNDATATSVVDDTGIAYGGSSTWHKVELALSTTDAKVYINDQLTNTITTELPAVSTPLYPYWLVRTPAASAKSLYLYKAGVITK